MQTFHHPLSPEEESHYLQKAKAGDLSARNILVEYNLSRNIRLETAPPRI